MINNPFFSIIIPSYNQGNFLDICLQSIVQQTFKDYEIIIQDNCSEDSTKYIFEKYHDHRNIHVYREKDFGQADAINRGLKKARGKWVTWQNCDDYFNNKNIFYKIYNEIILSKINSDLYYGNLNLNYFDKEKLEQELRFYGVNFFTLLFEENVISNQSSFWKLELHKKYGFLRNYYNSFDYEWFLRISKFCRFKKMNIKEPLSTFLIYDGQKSSNYSHYDKRLRKKILHLYRGKILSNSILVYILSKISLFFRFIILIKSGDIMYFFKKKFSKKKYNSKK
jgi:glycosyltransferase involved in cell wall biosynthesis